MSSATRCRWRHHRCAVAVAAALAMLSGVQTAAAQSQQAAQASSGVIQFDIPAQPLADALQAFARVSRQQVVFDHDAVAGRYSRALSGAYTEQDALRRLLEESGIEFRRGSRGVWLVGPSPARRPDTVSDTRAVDMDRLVVSASRTLQDPRHVASSVSVVSMRDMEKQQVGELRTALAQQPGITVANAGNVGGTTSVYIRGAYPHHTLLIVDGVRMNDRSASYDSFMGGADMVGYDRIEILRGPQSPMYGSSAMGGVILANTAHGGNDGLEGALSLAAGSFGTRSASAAAKGGSGAFGYSASLARYRTDNDLPENGYESWNYSTRLNYVVSPSLDIGFTYRGQEGEYQSIGSRFFYAPGTVDSANHLGTVYADWQTSDTVTTRFTAGFHRREYLWSDSWGDSEQTNKRFIAEWQSAWKPSDALELVAGANFESAEYDINGSVTEDEIYSGFLSGTWQTTDSLTLNAGVRYDDFETVGDAFTWRAGFAWMLLPATKLRGTYGTGFAAPGSSDRYGVPAWGQLPNPDIRPEESKGWDLGVEQSFLDGDVALSLSYFDNSFEGLIDWEYVSYVTYEGIYVNRDRASTRGVELGVTARPTSIWHLQLGYTYLEAKDDDTGQRLARRPRHTANASTWVDIGDRWTAGVGLHHVVDRVDSAGDVGDYTVARAFASYSPMQRLTLKVRAENLFDESYDDVYGYQALPRGVYGSLEWTF